MTNFDSFSIDGNGANIKISSIKTTRGFNEKKLNDPNPTYMASLTTSLLSFMSCVAEPVKTLASKSMLQSKATCWVAMSA